MTAGAQPSRRRGDHRAQWAVVAGLACLLAILVLTGVFFARSVRLQGEQFLEENDAIARSVAASVQAKEEGYLNVLLSYAGRFRFREAIKRRDRAEALPHLRQIAVTFPEMDRPFLADPAGVPWASYPEAPEVYGRSFAERDWYRGVSREWRPYMSDVFEGAASRALAVALVVPVRDLDGAVIGIIGSAQRLDRIRQWLLPIRVPAGDVYVVDRKGQFVFHRTRIGPERLADYARIPVVERVRRGEEGLAETLNPVEGEVRLSAYRPLPALGWGVVVQRSKNLALQQTHAFVVVAGAAGLALSLGLVGLGALATRRHREALVALAAVEEKSRQLEAAQAQLVRKERLAILGQLAAGLSHELRNPLGVIKNSAYFLKMVVPEDERVRKHLGILEREVGTASRIVGDLLDFARVRPPSARHVDLSVLAREVAERVSLGARVTLVLALAEDLPRVAVDPDQVGQTLGNLITNADQAMPEGGTLTIETSADRGGVLVAVADTGSGIAPENIEKIFQPLFTTKARGIGLGLAVVRELTEANGGAVSVESRVGDGSRFVLRFAAAEAR